MKIEVLISCMYQKDASIIQRSNIQSDVLIINQCDENRTEEFTFLNKEGDECKAKMIYTTERGLSKSRNMAIRNASGDICLICDDDERLEDDYAIQILNTFETSTMDIGAFKFHILGIPYINKTFWTVSRRINYRTALKISSIQIAFKRRVVLDNNLNFDEKIGSGMTKAGGEEKVFLHRCLECGLFIVYHPIYITSVTYDQSQWAHHIFSEEYCVDWEY